MANLGAGEQAYPRVNAVINSIAQWVKHHRVTWRARNEFALCPLEEITRIANDLGMSQADLEVVATKGPGSADLLKKMLTALGVDPEDPALKHEGVMHDLQRLCVTCSHKTECAQDLAAGTAAKNFYAYCPNAYTLDAIFLGLKPN